MQPAIQQFKVSWLILTYQFREPKDSVSFPNISWITKIQTEIVTYYTGVEFIFGFQDGSTWIMDYT